MQMSNKLAHIFLLWTLTLCNIQNLLDYKLGWVKGLGKVRHIFLLKGKNSQKTKIDFRLNDNAAEPLSSDNLYILDSIIWRPSYFRLHAVDAIKCFISCLVSQDFTNCCLPWVFPFVPLSCVCNSLIFVKDFEAVCSQTAKCYIFCEKGKCRRSWG